VEWARRAGELRHDAVVAVVQFCHREYLIRLSEHDDRSPVIAVHVLTGLTMLV
jgi:hypothetical protein